MSAELLATTRPAVQVPAIPSLKPTIADALVRFYTQYDGDEPRMIDALEAFVWGDDELSRMMIREAVWKLVMEYRAARRQHIKKELHGDTVADRRVFNGGHVGALVRRATELLRPRLMEDFALHDGTLIGDATRPALQAEANYNGKLSKSFARRARFAASVAALLPDDATTVRQAISEDRLEAEHKAAFITES